MTNLFEWFHLQIYWNVYGRINKEDDGENLHRFLCYSEISIAFRRYRDS